MPEWTHSDPAGLQNQFEAAIQRSKARKWRDDSIIQRGAELRALVMGTVLVCSRAQNPTDFIVSEFTQTDFPPKSEWPTIHHYEAASRVLSTYTLLADKHEPSFARFITAAGFAPQDLGVEGWPILLVKIAAHAVWAFAACYIAERYEDTIDRFLARGQAGDNLMAAQADAVKVIENHADAEVKLGKTIEYSPQENVVLDKLVQTQDAFANKKDPPKDNLPPITQPATSLGMGAILGIGIVAYFFLKGRS